MKKQYQSVIISLIFLAVVASACNFTADTNASGTDAALLTTASPDAGASTAQPLTIEPVITAAPPIVDTTPAPIVIMSPGESSSAVSQVTSPVSVTGEADFPFEGTLSLTLTGEDGSVLIQSTTQVDGEYGGRGPFSADLAFATDHDQPGRISVFTVSMRDGGLIYLTSVPVMVLASGSTRIQPAGSSTAPAQFIAPTTGETISGGTLVIHGTADQAFENSVNIAICGTGGTGDPDPVCGTVDNILESGTTLQTEPSGIEGQLTFSYVYHFFLTAETPARVAVFSISPRDGGIEWLVSVEFVLRP